VPGPRRFLPPSLVFKLASRPNPVPPRSTRLPERISRQGKKEDAKSAKSAKSAKKALCCSLALLASSEVTRDKPLHSLFGEYRKALRSAGRIESEMTDRIIKSSISILESFNHVRNEQSFAHDNPILNYEESLLIFNHTMASLRFLLAVHDGGRHTAATASDEQNAPFDDDLPF
jgi:hypothetical protein